MSLAIDFTIIPRLAKSEFRLPAGDFLPTTPPRARSTAVVDGSHAEFEPSYRVPDCVAALGAAFRQPLSGLFAAGLAL